PAPFGPITACSSPGSIDRLRSSVTTSAPKLLRSAVSASAGSATTPSPHEFAGDAEQAAAHEHHGENQERPEDHLPMLGEGRQPLLEEKECGRPDDRPVKRSHAAEQDHDDQFAGALPGHVGGADEFGGVAEQETGNAGQHAGD